MKQLLFILTIYISTFSFAQTQRQKDSIGGVCLYFDFDGQTVINGNWLGGTPIFAAASSVNSSSTNMDSIVNMAKEYLVGFPIVVTRDSTLYFIANAGKRIRVIFTPTCSWYDCGTGGVSYNGSMYFGDDTPSWVFDGLGTLRKQAIVGVHEAMHQLGLAHHTTDGFGTGETSIVPMLNLNSNLFSKNLQVFWSGINENSVEQNGINLVVFGNSNYSGIGARLNDAGNTINHARFIQKDQIIRSFIGVNDSDYYRIFIPSTQTVSISAIPYKSVDASLDVAIDLISDGGALITSSTNTATVAASVSQSLPKGYYYIKIRGDRGNPNLTTATSDGKIFMGNYTLTYTF